MLLWRSFDQRLNRQVIKQIRQPAHIKSLTSSMQKLIAKVAVYAIASVTVLSLIDLAKANENCEAMPAGPDRTNCFIQRARLESLKSTIAGDRARQVGSAAKLNAQTSSQIHSLPQPGRPK
jgi:hypothetical protein